jgi:hypothetical protein
MNSELTWANAEADTDNFTISSEIQTGHNKTVMITPDIRGSYWQL